MGPSKSIRHTVDVNGELIFTSTGCMEIVIVFSTKKIRIFRTLHVIVGTIAKNIADLIRKGKERACI